MALEILFKLNDIPFTTEYRFDETRLWKFDYVLSKNLEIAAEYEGLSGGRHQRDIGYTNDVEKYNCATLQGWKVYRFTAIMINDGRAATIIEAISEQIHTNLEIRKKFGFTKHFGDVRLLL